MWQLLMEVVLLLAAAFILGSLAQKLKQSAIIGYLAAGASVGPLLFNTATVAQVAELGVALLLFSIGLEFSFSRLKQLGAIALFGGTAQVVTTLAAFSGILVFLFPLSTAVALGAAVALSSTAVVLRVLVDRAAIDSVHGRNALGILLLQDVAVVPLVLLVTVLARGGAPMEIVLHLGKTVGAAVLLVAAFYFLFYHLVPRLLMSRGFFANRELVVLLSIVIALGSIWIAHGLHLSPALGAFLAGMLLAESPFATQIRADIGSIRTLFVTLFFTSVGMLADPIWFVRHLHLVLLALVLVIGGKALIVYAIARYFKTEPFHALATGLTLAQIGEFAFVLAAIAQEGGLIGRDQLDLVVSVAIVSMFLAPYFVANSEKWAAAILGRLFKTKWGYLADTIEPHPETGGHVLIIGFGPAGQMVAHRLQERNMHCDVIELNPRSAARAKEMGLHVHIGDATAHEILEHAGIHLICAVVITLPDPKTCRDVISNLRSMIPAVPILTRSRYHRYAKELEKRGATVVVDEESTVGKVLADEMSALFERSSQEAMACALAGVDPPKERADGPEAVLEEN
jgi:CPA2 family monovalent cation:H+ antiporter-2